MPSDVNAAANVPTCIDAVAPSMRPVHTEAALFTTIPLDETHSVTSDPLLPTRDTIEAAETL
jgi:hypothetical protein